MCIHDELSRLGYEFEDEFGSSEDHTEVWLNCDAGIGVAIEWFRLPEVARLMRRKRGS